MIDDILIVSLGAYSGCKTLYLNEYLNSEFTINVFVNWLEKAKVELAKMGTNLPMEYLNDLEYFEQHRITWVVDLEVDFLINLIESFKEMILNETEKLE